MTVAWHWVSGSCLRMARQSAPHSGNGLARQKSQAKSTVPGRGTGGRGYGFCTEHPEEATMADDTRKTPGNEAKRDERDALQQAVNALEDKDGQRPEALRQF